MGTKSDTGRHTRRTLPWVALVWLTMLSLLGSSAMIVSSAEAGTEEWQYRRGYNLGPAGHIADLGVIDGVPHIALQRSGEIHIVSLTNGGFLLRNRITNPAFSGSWGHLLAEIPDADGDGVTDFATFAGNYRLYVISGRHPLGANLSGEQAKIYSIDLAKEPRGSASMGATSQYALGLFADTIHRRDSATGIVIQTVTGAEMSSSIGDYTMDGVDDYLARNGDSLYVISGTEGQSGTAADVSLITLSDPATRDLGYAEDNNNIATVLGDLTGDGVPEIAVGSRLYRFDTLGGNYGRVVVFDGASAGVLYRIEPDQTQSNGVYFGNNVVSPGDLNGDGFNDLIVSARGYAKPGSQSGSMDGAIIAFSGIDGSELWRAYGDAETLGDYEVAILRDMNGDGLPELGVAGGNAAVWLSCNQTAGECGGSATAPAMDDDGIPDSIEDAAPNGGDGNFDGIPDRLQSNVASMPNAEDGTYVTLTSTGPTRLLGVYAFAPPLGAPDAANFPVGMFGFQVDGLQPGSAVIVTLTLHGSFAPTSHWKYGPESGNTSPHWYEFVFDGTTGATFSGNTITLHFIDGGRGDQDLSANGIVVDPSAPSTGGCVGAPGKSGSHRTGLVDLSTGKWQLYDCAQNQVTEFYFGNPGDVPIFGDWDGDGVETPGMYRQSDGFVYLRNSNTQGIADVRFFFGNPGDVPIAGDFDGDGFDTVSIYRPSSQTFFIINELGANEGGLGAAEFSYVFGDPGDKPFVGDFDGDGVETVGLHRESTGLVYFRNSHSQGNADAQFIFGDPGDRLIAGDWNADGKYSPALFRPSNTTMFFRYTNTQGNADNSFTAGEDGWMPVAGDIGH